MKTNSTKVLSEQELEQQVHDITQRMLVALSEWQSGVPTEYNVIKQQGRNGLVKLIQSQKLAWADMVINTHITPSNYKTSLKAVGALRKAQRQRNNLNASSGEEK